MGLKHISQQPADRLFVVDDQDAREFEESVLGGSVKKQRHDLWCCVVERRELFRLSVCSFMS